MTWPSVDLTGGQPPPVRESRKYAATVFKRRLAPSRVASAGERAEAPNSRK